MAYYAGRAAGQAGLEALTVSFVHGSSSGNRGLNKTKLAHAVYGTVFKNASSADQKRLIDRCRKAVSSRLKLHGKNLI